MGVLFSWALSVALAIRFKRGVEQFATFSIAIIIAPIFLGGLVFNLNVGIKLAIVLGFVSIVYIVYKMIREYATAKEIVFSTSSIAYLFFILLFCFLSIGRGYTGGDEFHFWGKLIKGYYNGEVFPYSNQPNHPEASVLWTLFATKTWPRLSEGVSIWAMCVMMISFLLPFMRFVHNGKLRLHGLMIGILIILIPFIMDTTAFSTILTDTLLGLAFGYTFVSIFEYYCERDEFYLLRIIIGMVSLCSFKRIGIALSSMVLICLIFVCLKKGNDFINDKRKKVLFLTSAIFIPPFIYILWKCYPLFAIAMVSGAIIVGGLAVIYNNYIYYNKPVVASLLPKLLFCVCSSVLIVIYRTTIMHDSFTKGSILDFFNFLFVPSRMFDNNIVKLSPFFALLCFGLFMRGYIFFCKKKEQNVLAKNVEHIMGMTVFVVLSCFAMFFVTAVFHTNVVVNSIYSPSLDRYMICIFFPLIMLSICAVLYIDKYSLIKSEVNVTAIVLACVLFIADLPSVATYFLDRQECIKFYGFSSAGIELTADDKLFYIQEVRGEETTDLGGAFEYEMYPAQISRMNRFHYHMLNENNHDYMNPDDFIKLLVDEGYTYVYMQTVDENFADIYGDVVEDASNIKSGDVYTLYETSDGYKLKRCSK